MTIIAKFYTSIRLFWMRRMISKVPDFFFINSSFSMSLYVMILIRSIEYNYAPFRVASLQTFQTAWALKSSFCVNMILTIVSSCFNTIFYTASSCIPCVMSNL